MRGVHAQGYPGVEGWKGAIRLTQVFGRELRANLKGLLCWAAGVFALVAAGFYKYAGVAASDNAMNALVNMLPRVIRVLVGIGSLPLSSPEGYYACMYLWIAMVAFLHAAMLGATILAKEERDRTAEFLFTKPIRRQGAILGKMLAGTVNLFAITVVAWGTTLIFFLPQAAQVGVTNLAPAIHRTMAGMFVTQLVFFFAGFLGAAALPGHKAAGQLAAGLVLGTYLLSVMMELAGAPRFLDVLSPFRYFYAENVLREGLSPLYLALSAVLTLGAGVLAVRLFARRNLRN